MLGTIRKFALVLFVVPVIPALALEVTVDVQQHSYCGRASGVINAIPSGGVPPYTFLWSNGGDTRLPLIIERH